MLDRATRTQATANIEIEVTRFLEAIRRGAELPDRRSQLPTAQTRSALTPAELSLVWTSVRAQWRIDNPTNLPEDLRLVIADQMSNSYLLQDNYNRLRRNATAELIPSLIAAQGIIDFIVQAGQLAPEARTIMRRWLTDEIGAPCNLPHFFIACLFGPAEQRAEFVDRLASALAQANIALPETPLPQLVREAADRYGSPASAAWWWWLQGLTRARP
jgi:hypothetical protein